MIVYENTPPHSNPETFLCTSHAPCGWITVEALAVSETDCPASIDNITSDMEDRPTEQIKDRSMHSRQTRCHKVVSQR